MAEEEKIIPLYQKDLYEDHLDISFRISNDDYGHGDLLRVSVELIGNVNDTDDNDSAKRAKENNDMEKDEKEGE